MRPVARSPMALFAAVLFSACDRIPTATPPLASESLLMLQNGTADIALTASATIGQNGDVWSLAKSGSLSGSMVTWTITATKTTVATGQLVIDGQLTLTNSGDGPATIGNVVVNLQKRVNSKWVTVSSDVANATQGDAATTAAIHQKASSEDLGTFTENSASGAIEFRDATTNSVVSLVPQVLIDAADTRSLRFSAAFDNNDAALQLMAGTPIRAEVIVTFGNATVNGNSTANVDINGNGTIDADEAHVRSVSSRLALAVPAAAPGGAVTLTDALEDITVTGDVTFSNAQFTIGATNGTVTATVNGGTDGGTITNCAHLTTADQSLDLQSCSTVAVAAVPPGCTPGAPACGWDPGDMTTGRQSAWGDGTSAVGGLLSANFNPFYPNDFIVGGTHTLTLRDAPAVFTFLPQLDPAGVLTGDVVDPMTTSAGELAGEIVALQLNVDFSDLLSNAVDLDALRFCNFGAVPSLNGQTVAQFLATANNLLGGGGSPLSPSTTASVARLVNTAFLAGAPSTFAQANLVAGPNCGWQPGDMRTFTQIDWGDSQSSAGGLLNVNYNALYGGGILSIGGTFFAAFTTASSVFAYLPQVTPASTLTASVVNPVTTSSGELGGELLALRLNVDFSSASIISDAVDLGSLRFCNNTDAPALNGQTVNQFLATANNLLGGGGGPFAPSVAATVAREVNNAFVGGIPSTFAQASLVAGACP